MNIFMFSVSLLLAIHHVHLHHLCSILHCEQCWLASWKVGELNLGRKGTGLVQLTSLKAYLAKSDVFVEENCACSYVNLHPVLCSCLLESQADSSLNRCFCFCRDAIGHVLIWAAGVAPWLLLLCHRGAAVFAPTSCSRSLSCAAPGAKVAF